MSGVGPGLQGFCKVSFFIFTVKRTELPKLICGVTSKSRATFRYPVVVKGVAVVAAPVVAYEPVWTGTSWPISKAALWLSNTTTEGVDKILTLVVCCNALKMAWICWLGIMPTIPAPNVGKPGAGGLG